MSNQNTLVDILKIQIDVDRNTLAKTRKDMNSSVIGKNRDLIIKIQKDINMIIDLDLQTLKDILNELNIEDEQEKEHMYQGIESIRWILTINKEKDLTFEISARQVAVFNAFVNKLNKVKETIKVYSKEQQAQLDKMEEIINKYINLLEMLSNKDNQEFVTDVELLTTLFRSSNLLPMKRREVLTDLLKYNQQIYNNVLKRNTYTFESKKLEKEDVENTLKLFGYEFEYFDENIKKALLNFGNIRNIREVLEALKENNFPRLSEKNQAFIFASLLVNSNKKTINEVVEFSKNYNLLPIDLSTILLVFINPTQENTYIPNNEVKKKNILKDAITFNSYTNDFYKNCKFLKEVGLEPKMIIKKCKQILIMNHEKLVNNYNLFKSYGFSFYNSNLEIGLLKPSLSCLLSTKFVETADQYIEIMPEGHEYIKNNLSGLTVYREYDNLIFYNIYYSLMNNNEYGDFKFSNGPFNNNSDKLKLRGEITRTGIYKNIPYHNIMEQTKKFITKTIEPQFKNKELFDQCISEIDMKNVLEKSEDISLDDLNKLEKFTDLNCPYRYNIDGVLISKNKVARIFNILKNADLADLENSILYAITYHTILNAEQFEKIKNKIIGRGN